MKTCHLMLLLGGAVAAAAHARTFPLMPAPPRPRPRQEDVVIDGRQTTIGLAIAYYFRGILTDSLEIFQKVLNILHPSAPEDDIDYFELIKEDVEQVVGDYIDQHNMAQLEVYKDSLATLLQRYTEAPETSSIYPDKNTVANSLSISIISNRFLVEAGERPQSMIIHYADIASIHILVLRDVALRYSSFSGISRWWVDLNEQLDHYIAYGHDLQNTVVDWRNDMVDCSYDEGRKYDVWTVVDHVDGITDKCKQVHGTYSCDDHCQSYLANMNRKVTQFMWHYMGKALSEWENIKLEAEQMAAQACRFYRPPLAEEHQ